VVGVEEAIRRACRERGGDFVVDSMLSTTTAYSNGAVHAVMTDSSNSEELEIAMEKTMKRLREKKGENEVIVERAYARVGLMGNPGDGYGGKVIAATIENFYAEVTLRPRRDARVSFVPDALDANSFESFDAMTSHLSEFGVDGGIRLLKSLARRLHEYFEKNGRSVDTSRGFDVSYSSTIPIQLGLSGSSAIVVAGLNAMLTYFGACDVPLCDRATLALRVEQDVGISAGPMDRFIQVYGGLRLMDFSEFRETERAVVENLDASKVPPLFLVWAERGNASHSGRVHARVKKRFEEGESAIVDAVRRLSALAERAAVCVRECSNDVVASTFAELMNANFSIRRELFDDDELGAVNLEMVSVLRDCGYGVKFAGSGGACLVAGVDDGADVLARTCRAHGWRHERIAIKHH
jgi:glucuronokinase